MQKVKPLLNRTFISDISNANVDLSTNNGRQANYVLNVGEKERQSFETAGLAL